MCEIRGHKQNVIFVREWVTFSCSNFKGSPNQQRDLWGYHLCFLSVLPQYCIGNCVKSLHCAFWRQGLTGIVFPINNASERKHGPFHYHCEVHYSNYFETIEHTSSLSLFMIIKAMLVFVEKWKVWRTSLKNSLIRQKQSWFYLGTFPFIYVSFT